MTEYYTTAIDALHDMDDAASIDALWSIFTDFMKSYGADLMSYHHIPPGFAPDALNFQIIAEGFSDDWVKRYTENEMHLYDPITQLVRFRLNPFRWSEIGEYSELTERQEDYLRSLYSWMKGDGLGVPAFGPSSRNGYFGVGCQYKNPDWARNEERTLYWTCQAFHHRFCELHMKTLPKDFELSPRESSVVNWLAKGYSEELVCGLINARLESVNSTINTVMKKMGVSDRASMILRATACGIIER